MDTLTGNELAIAIGLAVLLGISIGIMGSAAYANWRVRRITAGHPPLARPKKAHQHSQLSMPNWLREPLGT